LGPSAQKNFGGVVFGKQRRLVETKETIKCKFSINHNIISHPRTRYL